MSDTHNEERFDPSRHDLAYAAKRLKEISEKNYQQRLDAVLARHEEKDKNELATGGVIEHPPLLGRESGPEWVTHPLTLTVQPTRDPITEERLRAIIVETIKQMLYPESDGVVTHRHRRVKMWDEHGDEWCGVLYWREKEPPT